MSQNEPPRYLEAVSLRRDGRLREAVALYREILAQYPGDANVLEELGAIEIQRKNPQTALTFLDQALALKPKNTLSLINRGIALRQLGRCDDALASYNLALSITANDVSALNCRGNVLSDLKQFNEAVGSYDCALAIEPNNAEVLKNRGIALRHADRQEEALASFDRALSIKPDHAEVLNLRGETLKHLGRFDDALASFDRALAVRPRDSRTLVKRGDLMRGAKRHYDALASYDHALELDPDNLRALQHRASTLRELFRFEEALTSCDRALLIKPGDASLLATRGIILECLGRISDAIASFRQALLIKPDDAAIHTALIFALNFDAAVTAREQQSERSRWNSQHARRLRNEIRSHENTCDPQRQLRIGYVSGHFKGQSATYGFGGVLLHHDPERFEIICYSDTVREDEVTDRLRCRADKWHRTAALSDPQLAELIRRDRIDILVDLVGHMGGNRLLAFARKPAPIQVTAWGEPTGTGLEVMDYLLADPVLVPEVERGLLAETVVDLPNFLGYWTPEPIPEPGSLPALRNGYVTFGSFNRLEKITDATLRAWAAILLRLPQARLIIKTPLLSDASQRRRIEDALKSADVVATERLILLGASNRASHFAAYQNVDVALDTFPHSGGMTTLDALWMGIPVVTWAGQTISSRLAAASLAALGLRKFTASGPEEFVDLAVAATANIEELSVLRGSLRKRIAASDFGDPVRYARAVESAYRDMWQRWCSNRAGCPANYQPTI